MTKQICMSDLSEHHYEAMREVYRLSIETLCVPGDFRLGLLAIAWISRLKRISGMHADLGAGLRDGLGDGLGAGLNAGLDVDLYDGLGDGLNAGLGDGLNAGLDDGLRDGLGDGLNAGLHDGLGAGLRDGLNADLYAGLDDGLRDGLGAGLRAGLRAGLHDGLDAGLDDGLRDGLRSNLHAGLNAGLGAGLGADLNAGLGAGLDDGLRDGLGAGLRAGLRAGLDYGLGAGLYDGLNDGLKGIELHYCGVFWKWWAVRYLCGSVCGCKLDMRKLALLNLFTNACPIVLRLPSKQSLMPAPKPQRIRWNITGETAAPFEFPIHELHGNGAPSVEYWGLNLYHWHNVKIPERMGTRNSEQWDPRWITDEDNAEVRRVLISEIGFERCMMQLGAELLNSWNGYELHKLSVDMPTQYLLLKMNCTSTGDTHVLRVPPDIGSAERAITWVNHGHHPDTIGEQA